MSSGSLKLEDLVHIIEYATAIRTVVDAMRHYKKDLHGEVMKKIKDMIKYIRDVIGDNEFTSIVEDMIHKNKGRKHHLNDNDSLNHVCNEFKCFQE